MKPEVGKTYVYFMRPIGMPGPVKIGCSRMLKSRLENMAAWSPYPLEIVAIVPGNFRLEDNIHCCFADVHSHREWFHPNRDLLRLIDQLKAGVPIEQAIDLTKRKGSIRTASLKKRFTPINKLRLRLGAAVWRIGRKHGVRSDEIENVLKAWEKRSDAGDLTISADERLSVEAFIAVHEPRYLQTKAALGAVTTEALAS